jgi:signal transduction histidine kinase/DNA-binding response OmpR family regulator
MKLFRDLSISWKLTLLAVVTSSLVLAGTAVAFSVIDHRMTKAEMIESYSTTADVFGRNCLKSLDFGDKSEASMVLSWLHMDSHIDMACLYDIHHKEFASFQRNEMDSPPFDAVKPLDSVFEGSFGKDGFLHLIRPVLQRNGEVVGHLYLRIEISKLWNRLWSQVRLAVLVLCVSLLVSIALAAWLQQAISSPILQLVKTAHRVVQSNDYSLRAHKDSHDELGELVDEFNEMLSTIEKRDIELLHHRENLTDLVLERTAELEHKTKEALAASVAKSDFLANMSHEIRTPLNAIMGYTDMLRRGWADSPEERDEMLATVHSSGRHLMTVINDILDLSKIESGRVDVELLPQSPHAILSDVVSLMRVQFREKNLTLDYNWEGLVPQTIATDGQRLRQILINVLGNAKKFTPTGGVRIIARVVTDARSSQLIVNIIDSGVGIPQDKQNQIFEPFMQADTSVTRRFGGTGLGLSISRRLARLMGGDLTVESSPGAGSDFRLSVATGDLSGIKFVPLNAVGDVITSYSSHQKTSGEMPQLAGLRVLLVDDGDSNRKLISLILKRAGAVITEASNGKQACDIALGGRTFDVILLDMQMPIMDGYTAAATMRSTGLKTPIVALTAHAMTEDRDKCMNAGCSDYLTKPVSADELLERMNVLYARLSNPGTTAKEASVPQEPIRSKLPVDDPEFASIVIDFIVALRREVKRLALAVQNRDPVGALTASHWIKGAAGTAGFGCFTTPSIQITTAVRSNDWTDVDHLLLAIQDYVDRIEAPELIPEFETEISRELQDELVPELV